MNTLNANHPASSCVDMWDVANRSSLEESAKGMARGAATWDAATMSTLEVCRDHGPRCSHDNGCEKNVYARGVCKRHHQLKIKQGGGRVNPNNGTGTLAPVIGHGIIGKDIPIMARLAKACHHPILRPLKLVMALRSKYVDATYYVKILRNPR